MPAPHWLGRFNRTVSNRLIRPVAGHLPGVGIVVHRGRRSGRSYRTPVNVYRRPEGIAFALTYGTDVDWARNVLAAQHAQLVTRGRTIRLTNPRLVRDPERALVPPLVRPILRAVRVDAFIVADIEAESGPSG